MIVRVHSAKDVLTPAELSNVRHTRKQCHYNAAFNTLVRDGVKYVEGYIASNGVAHAINRTPEGVYFDATLKGGYEFLPVREYTSDEIIAIHSAQGRSFLTIGDDNYYLKQL